MEPVTVYLGLGSNLGEREVNLAKAIRMLSQPLDSAQGHRIKFLRASSIYETAPWGYTEQPLFLNCVVEAETTLPPSLLLQSVQTVEKALGRKPGIRWGPRVIDVDILLYGGLTIDQPDLQIPHPRIPQRALVLIPLAELAADLVHPTLGLPISHLAQRVEGQEGVKRWGPPPSIPDPSQN